VGALNPSFTWQGQPTPAPTLAEQRESCIANAVEAAAEEARLRRLHDSLPPGDPRLTGDKKTMPLSHEIEVCQHEQRHWRAMARYFEGRIREEVGRAPALRQPPPSVFQPPAAPPADPRLPLEHDPDDISTFAVEDPGRQRDPGADDVDEGEDWRH
jgi:hypothetical protein